MLCKGGARGREVLASFQRGHEFCYSLNTTANCWSFYLNIKSTSPYWLLPQYYVVVVGCIDAGCWAVEEEGVEWGGGGGRGGNVAQGSSQRGGIHSELIRGREYYSSRQQRPTSCCCFPPLLSLASLAPCQPPSTQPHLAPCTDLTA